MVTLVLSFTSLNLEHTKLFIGQPSYLIYSLLYHFCIDSPVQHLSYLTSTTTPLFHNATTAPLHCLNVCPIKHQINGAYHMLTTSDKIFVD